MIDKNQLENLLKPLRVPPLGNVVNSSDVKCPMCEGNLSPEFTKIFELGYELSKEDMLNSIEEALKPIQLCGDK